MDILFWSNFKKKFENFAYISIYCGYFFHLIIFFGPRDGLIYILLGYIYCLIFMFQVFFNPVVVILHSSIFLYYLDTFYPSIEGKLFSIAFFLPFYTMVLYFFLSFFGIDEKIELTLKNRRLNKIEAEKKRKQMEWDNLPKEEKDKILNEKKRIEIERENKIKAEKKKREKEIEKEKKERLLKIALEKEKQIELEKIKLEEEKQRQIELEIETEKLKNKKIEEQKRIEELKEIRLKEAKEKKEREHKEYIKRKILETERKKELELEAIQELIDEGLIDDNKYSGKNIRESIPTEVKVAVWNRDKQRCVSCDSMSNLEFDHIIPVSKGGANTIKNIQLLCMNCNRKKSNKIV